MAAPDEEITELRLAELFEQGLKGMKKLDAGKISAKSEEYETTRQAAVDALEKCSQMLDSLRAFSQNETYHEHSTEVLRFVPVSAYLAKLAGMQFPPVDSPERDAIRLKILELAESNYKTFLKQCISLGFEFAREDNLGYYLNLPPGARRGRDDKIAHTKATMASEEMVRELQEMLDATSDDEHVDDDLRREHQLCLIALLVYKACDDLEMVNTELHMLKMMQSRDRPPMPTRPQQTGPREPPLVLTKEKVKELSLSGRGIERAGFKLLTKGWGRIGAPTMTQDEAFEMDIATGKIVLPDPNKPKEKGPDDTDDEESPDEAEEEEKLYKARAFDEYKDWNRAGDGNRYNKG